MCLSFDTSPLTLSVDKSYHPSLSHSPYSSVLHLPSRITDTSDFLVLPQSHIAWAAMDTAGNNNHLVPSLHIRYY